MKMFHLGAQIKATESDLSHQAFQSTNETDLLSKIEAFSDELKGLLSNSQPTLGAVSSFPELAKKLYKCRRKVDRVFELQGFSTSPAWDIMLDLYEAETENRPTSVSSACIGAACPATTALRWLGVLEQMGLIERADDPDDKRRALVSLTDKGRGKTSEALSHHV